MGFYNLTNTFASLSGNQPASKIDQNFQDLAIGPLYASAVAGSANAIQITVPLTLTSGYQTGMSFNFVASYANTSATPTLNVNGAGAKLIVRDNNSSLNPNDISANGAYQVYYDGTQFHLMNPTSNTAHQVTNVVINGGMNIDQRLEGAAVTPTVAPTYLVDRFAWWYSGIGVISGGQSTNAPTSLTTSLQRSLSFQVTTIDGSIAGSDYYSIQYGIEGFDSQPLIGNTFTVSFYVRSSVTGTYCFAVRNAGFTNSYIQEYTISVADTWQLVTLTFPGGLPSASFTNVTNSFNAFLIWTVASNLSGTANVWTGTSANCTTNQVNFMGTLNAIFRITGVQLFQGSSTPEWEPRLIADEYDLCQRYYQKSYVTGVRPGTITGSGTIYAYAQTTSTDNTAIRAYFATRMRTIPIVTWWNPATGGFGTIRNYTALTNPTATANAPGDMSTGPYITLGTAPALNATLGAHWTAEIDA
jgi:hypothetical protein